MRFIISENSEKFQDLFKSDWLTLIIYFLLHSTDWIAAEQKDSFIIQKLYSQTDKKKLLEENINFQCQWTWKRNVWVHSKNFWWFQLSSSSELQSTALYWFECVKATWIWCHDLSHAKWSWWSARSHCQKKLTKN